MIQASVSSLHNVYDSERFVLLQALIALRCLVEHAVGHQS